MGDREEEGRKEGISSCYQLLKATTNSEYLFCPHGCVKLYYANIANLYSLVQQLSYEQTECCLSHMRQSHEFSCITPTALAVKLP